MVEFTLLITAPFDTCLVQVGCGLQVSKGEGVDGRGGDAIECRSDDLWEGFKEGETLNPLTRLGRVDVQRI